MSSPEARFVAHERMFELLACLPERMRGWNLCRDAVRVYIAAGEPPYQSDFWCQGLGDHQRKPLWQLIGQALEVGGKPAGLALELLEEIRTGVKVKRLAESGVYA